MSGAQTKVGIQLDWEVAGRDKIIQAVMDSRLYDAELKKLKATSDGSRQSAAQIVDAMIRQADAHRRVRTEMDAVTSAGRKMDATMGAIGASVKQVASAVSTINPQIGGLVSGIEGVLAAGSGLGGVLAASTAAIVGMGAASIFAAKSIGDYQQHVENVKQTLGLTSAEFGGLTVAAVNVNKTFEQIEPALDMFVRKLGEAREGSKEALDVFQGIDINQSTGAVLQDIVAKLEGIQDPAKRAAEAGKYFSKQWHEILPVITQDMKANSDQAVAWSITLSSSAAAAALKTNLAFDKMALRWKGFMNQMASDQAKSGEDWAKWATGAIDWLSKLQHKMAEKYDLNMTMKEGGTPALKTNLQNFFSHFGETEKAPEGGAVSHGLSDEQQKQVDAIQDQIAGMERLRGAIKLSIAEEVQALSKLEEQAIAMKDQVVAARELLLIRRQIASLLGQNTAQFGPAIPKDVQQRLDFEGLPNKEPMSTPDVNLEPFVSGMTELERLMKTTAEETEKFGDGSLRDLNQQFHLSGEESLKFARLVQANQAQIAAAYAVSDAAGMKAAKHFADQAKQQQKAQDLDRSAAETGRQAVRDLVHSAVTDMEHFWSAAANIIEQAIQKILEAAILSAIPIPGLAAGGTIAMAHGGTLAIPAQHGLMLSGVRGRDTIPIAAQKGEMFVSTSDTDDLRAFRSEMRQQMAQLTRDGVGGGGDTYYIDIPVYANYVDESTMNTHVERVLIPAIQRATGKKGHRGH